MQTMQGTATRKLSLFEQLKAVGTLKREAPAQVERIENSLRMLTAAEKASG
jgi:hypothetical protein